MTPPLAAEPTFAVTPAPGEIGRVVFASPHSGVHRPDDMGTMGGLSIATLRSAEDVGVDRLAAPGPLLGAPLIAGRVSRAYVDLNRSPSELDPDLVSDCVAPDPTAKVLAGFGVIPRRAGDGTALYDRRLSLAEAEHRLARVHAPYHAALAELMQAARARHGVALLIDWHSMPSRAAPAGRSGRGLDVVLGDRHGSACRGATTRRVRALFDAQGWRVGLNSPYAGGYSTQTWGRPDEGFQAIQVELNRALYLDQRTLEPSADYDRFAKALDRVITALATEPWAR
ncbi:MAG: N-formylglutamate amidohydrolase [Alphaproteobacteria bacterium]|nr:N-formylglutamate amidohydrolase [Alphaproteobacteria bacterium]MBU2378834.1 N-formylglutamate amidohydrolase [Alphaproteobacteria bacterium]